jgi:hypothetical protein
VLGCWCAPRACHGDVLVRLAEGLDDARRDEFGAVSKLLGEDD